MTSLIAGFKHLEYLILLAVLTLLFIVLISINTSSSYLVLLVFSSSLLISFFCVQVKGFLPLFFVLLSITLLSNSPGIQPIELPFYSISVIVAGFVFLELITGRIIIHTSLDKLFLLLLFLIPYGIILGIINGASVYLAFGETTFFLGILIYFPLRKYLDQKRFRYILGVILTLILLYVLIRNVINYRLLIIQAVLPWQTEKARVAGNEVILLIASLFCLSIAAITSTKWKQILSTILFIAFIGGLVLTQSRGYWLAFAIGALIIFYFINTKGKIRILLTFLVLTSSSIILASIFFGDFLALIIKGLTSRFQSLGSGKLDISLLERLLESKTVLGMMIENPIAGYGFGYTYTKKILFYDHFIKTSYVHNGYLAMWLKFGIVGVVTFISIWVIAIRNSYKLYHSKSNEFDKSVSLTISGSVLGIILVNNTSPQILTFESILFVTIFCAYISSKVEILKKINQPID